MINNFFESLILSSDVLKNVLSDHCLLRGACATELIKVAVKPVVDLLVNLVVVITDLLAGFTLHHGLGLSSSAVLICAADVDSVVAGETRIPGENIG